MSRPDRSSRPHDASLLLPFYVENRYKTRLPAGFPFARPQHDLAKTAMLRSLSWLACTLLAVHSGKAASVVHLAPISGIPSNVSGTLDRRLASFSIEFSFLPDFGGNTTNPNTLTQVDSYSASSFWISHSHG